MYNICIMLMFKFKYKLVVIALFVSENIYFEQHFLQINILYSILCVFSHENLGLTTSRWVSGHVHTNPEACGLFTLYKPPSSVACRSVYHTHLPAAACALITKCVDRGDDSCFLCVFLLVYCSMSHSLPQHTHTAFFSCLEMVIHLKPQRLFSW